MVVSGLSPFPTDYNKHSGVCMYMDIPTGYVSRSRITSVSKDTYIKIMYILPNYPGMVVKGDENNTWSWGSDLGLPELS